MSQSLDEIHLQARNHCDREALHSIGSIQGGVGHVIFVEWPSTKIIAHSSKENVDYLLQDVVESHMTAIRQNVNDMIANRSKRSFLFLRNHDDSTTTAVSVSTATPDFSIICLELEDAGDTSTEQTVYLDSLLYLGHIMQYENVEAVTKAAVETLMNVLHDGYDRGMVYRFMGDETGEVLHEITKNDGTTKIKSSYLGLRFPASDIPLPARRLYVLNGHRYIHDTEMPDVPLLFQQQQPSTATTTTSTDNNNHNCPIDMTQCRMRAVSKYHIMYLRNMGVRASMSLPIIVEGELWGIIAFHGYSRPYRPTLHQRIACETLSTLVSVRVEALVRKQRNERSLQLSNIFLKWNVEESVVPNIYRLGRSMLRALDVDVISVVVEGFDAENSDTIISGDKSLAPGNKFWTAFGTFPSGQVLTVASRKECESFGLSEVDCPANGFAYFREGKLHVMLGRAASSKDVVWAGNPDEAKLKVKDAFHPRKSFDAFMKKAHQEARVWTKTDLSILNWFADRLCRISHENTLKCLRETVENSNAKYVSAVNKARDNYEFFAHLSHELRTPFHGVMGCLNLLNDSINELTVEGMQELIQGALASGNHMVSLLNDILSLSKDKYLAHNVNQDTVIFQSMVFEAVESFRSLASKQGLKLDCDVVPNDDKALIVTDRTKIIQIIANLISNALKFARTNTTVVASFRLLEDSGAASAWCAQKTSQYSASVFCAESGSMVSNADVFMNTVALLPKAWNKWLCFNVDDCGCGMEHNDLERMFEPYTQASQGSNRTFEGTGLGLFISVSLCLRLGGFIACASTAGSGTSFFVAIPVQAPINNQNDVRDTDSANLDSTQASTESDADIPIFGPVLIVDDSPMNLKLLSRQLGNALKRGGKDNIEIIQATGGGESVEMFKTMRPSVVIMDYHMPEIDGSLATKMIREIEKSEGCTPSYVIAYTADGTDKASRFLFERGADELLEKPPPKDFATRLVSRFVPVKY